MTTSVNLIDQIKLVLNRHSEDPYFDISTVQDIIDTADKAILL